jgi:hypothetical protein
LVSFIPEGWKCGADGFFILHPFTGNGGLFSIRQYVAGAATAGIYFVDFTPGIGSPRTARIMPGRREQSDRSAFLSAYGALFAGYSFDIGEHHRVP